MLKGYINKDTFEEQMASIGYILSPKGTTSGYVNLHREGIAQQVYLTRDYRKDRDGVELNYSNRTIVHLSTLQSKLDETFNTKARQRTRRQLEENSEKTIKSAMEYLGVKFSESYVPGCPSVGSSSSSFAFKYVTDAPESIQHITTLVTVENAKEDIKFRIALSNVNGSETMEGYAFIKKFNDELEEAMMIGSL